MQGEDRRRRRRLVPPKFGSLTVSGKQEIFCPIKIVTILRPHVIVSGYRNRDRGSSDKDSSSSSANSLSTATQKYFDIFILFTLTKTNASGSLQYIRKQEKAN